MKKMIWTALAALLIGLPTFAQEGKKEETQEKKAEKAESTLWIADFDKAVEAAKKEKKDLLVDFTGSDWCVWCKRLHEEVFSKDEFIATAPKGWILCSLDFPQGDDAKAKVPNEKRNKELMEKHGIQGFPTILLMTADGEVFGRMGYQEGGPAKYLTDMAENATTGKKAIAEVKELSKQFAAADAKAKPAIIEKAITSLLAMKPDAPGVDALAEIIKNALTIDADNKAGLKLKAIKAMLKFGKADDATTEEAKKMDPKNENGVLEQVVAAQCQKINSEDALKDAVKAITDLDALGPIKDKEVAKNLYVNCAFWNKQFLKDEEAAKKWAKKAKEFAGDDKRMNEFLDSILK